MLIPLENIKNIPKHKYNDYTFDIGYQFFLYPKNIRDIYLKLPLNVSLNPKCFSSVCLKEIDLTNWNISISNSNTTNNSKSFIFNFKSNNKELTELVKQNNFYVDSKYKRFINKSFFLYFILKNKLNLDEFLIELHNYYEKRPIHINKLFIPIQDVLENNSTIYEFTDLYTGWSIHIPFELYPKLIDILIEEVKDEFNTL